ncbi:conjugative transposon protein TraN [Parapedobacter sp. ISTM3]|uniref:conjugative transposon protein TraN n=1 Tax=Parapedobacter sp. ISTM3 TaxID=2800130 RepID=UPI001904C73B|nr:conjugative transposon protein TraN [Parapedobacter sp. ISTM3]MBK1439792.1 conjugative transposon protein TraN [Parapedobacter sp. ISTM3]
MKNLIIPLLALLVAPAAVAQEVVPVKAKQIVSDYPLEITWHKTTLLLFPSPIQDADRGDAYVLAERIDGVENVLKVKAGERDFRPSNLHVITTDGRVYAFTVTYADQPPVFTIDMGKQPPHSPVTFDGISLNSRDLEFAAAAIKGSPPFIRGVGQKRHGMGMRLDGVFIKADVLFFRYNLKNNTQIRHDAAAPRFYIRDKKRAKRTAVQDTEMEAVFVQHSGVPENAEGQTIIIAFPKFTIAESKYFVTEITETGGDRNVECRIDQKKLLRARKLD